MLLNNPWDRGKITVEMRNYFTQADVRVRCNTPKWVETAGRGKGIGS